MHCSTRIVLTLLTIAVGGCSSPQPGDDLARTLQQATRIELLSLDPHLTEAAPPGSEAGEASDRLYGWRILGITVIADANAQSRLVTAFRTGVDTHDGQIAACFAPRHAIRAIVSGHTHEFLICFQCRQVTRYIDGRLVDGFGISPLPEPTFDALLSEAGIELSAKN